jgi:hypothetical protein
MAFHFASGWLQKKGTTALQTSYIKTTLPISVSGMTIPNSTKMADTPCHIERAEFFIPVRIWLLEQRVFLQMVLACSKATVAVLWVIR